MALSAVYKQSVIDTCKEHDHAAVLNSAGDPLFYKVVYGAYHGKIGARVDKSSINKIPIMFHDGVHVDMHPQCLQLVEGPWTNSV